MANSKLYTLIMTQYKPKWVPVWINFSSYKVWHLKKDATLSRGK